MAETFKFELVSPERLLISTDVSEVIVPGAEGDFTMLPNHAPFISTLRPGILRIVGREGRDGEFFVRGGFAEASPDALTVLAEMAIPAGDLTTASLDKQISQAEDDLAAAQDDEIRYTATDLLERLVSLRDARRLAA